MHLPVPGTGFRTKARITYLSAAHLPDVFPDKTI